MDYFKKYGLNDEEIDDIKNYIDNDDVNNYYVNELDVIEILDYLISIGIDNIKDILKYKANIFYEKLDNIKKSFDNRKNIVKLINEDITNFELIGY